MAPNAGSATALYIIDYAQAEQAAAKIRAIWAGLVQAQNQAGGSSKTVTAEEVKLAQALARTAEAEARRALATTKRVEADARANRTLAQAAVEEQRLQTEIAKTAAAEDRAATSAIRRQQAESRANGGGGGLGPALPRTLDGLSGSALTVAKGFLTIQAAQKGFEFVRIGAAAADTTKAFDGLAQKSGTTSQALLANLRAAADGTIRDTDLIKSANLGLLLTNGRIAKDLPQIIEIARAAAKSTGQDINFIYDSLVRGIARGSPRIIDNAGITLDASAAFETYARSIGKSADKLTTAEQQQATLNAVLKSGAEIVQTVGIDADSSSTKIDRAVIAVKNLGDALATKIAPFLGESAQGFANLLNTGSIAPGTDAAGDQVQGKLIRNAAGYDAYAAAVMNANQQIKDQAGFFAEVTNGLSALTPAEFAYTQALIQRGAATGQAITDMRAHGAVLRELNDTISIASAGDAQLKTELLAQVPALAAVASGTEEEKNKVLDLIAARADGTLSGDAFLQQLNALVAAHDAAAQAAYQEERELRNLARTFDAVVPAANAAAAAIAGIRGAQSPFAGRSLGFGPQIAGALGGGAKGVGDQVLGAANALRQSQNQLALAQAKTAAQRIAILQRELGQTTDQVEKNRILAQIAQERNSLDKAHSSELDKQLKLNEGIRDSLESQYKAQLDAAELTIRDRQERRKEDQEIAAAQRILASGRASQQFKDAAADKLALINIERQKRALEIQDKSATAGGTIINGKLYQSVQGGGRGALPTAPAGGTLPAIPVAPAAPTGAGGIEVLVYLDSEPIAAKVITRMRSGLQQHAAAGGATG